MDLPARVQSPEEHELATKRTELASVEADVVEQELRHATLQAELTAFEAEYLRIVGARYAELDALEVQIAEIQAARAPGDDAAQSAAAHARSAAEASAEATRDRAEQEPLFPFEPSAELTTLYRAIARRLHPDLGFDEDDRARRHTWMTKVNEAYRHQDYAALMALQADWEASPDSVPGSGVASDLVRVIRQIAQVRRRLDRIQHEIRVLETSKLHTLYMRHNARRNAGSSLIEEMAERLNKQIDAAQQRLDHLELVG